MHTQPGTTKYEVDERIEHAKTFSKFPESYDFALIHNKTIEKQENTNCVKKDKQGKCPATPKSPKPTPKKKAADAK